MLVKNISTAHYYKPENKMPKSTLFLFLTFSCYSYCYSKGILIFINSLRKFKQKEARIKLSSILEQHTKYIYARLPIPSHWTGQIK